jgi:hypothetical protein
MRPCYRDGLLFSPDWARMGLVGTKEIAEHIVRQLTTLFNDDADRYKATDSYITRTTEFARDYFFIIPLRPLCILCG